MSASLRRTVVLAVAVVMAAGTLVPAGAVRPVEGQTYLTVLDNDRRPVLGLSAEDFAMRDGAVRQPVLDAEPATSPLAIAVVLDGFEAADRADIAAGLAASARMLETADPAHRISVVETQASRGPVLVALTSDRARLDAVIARVTPSAGGRASGLADSLARACQVLRSVSGERRVLLAMARRREGDGAVAPAARAALTDALLVNKIALWTIEVGPAQSTPLDTLLGDASDLGGGVRQIVDSTSVVPDAATRLANLWLSQYLVTFAWPNPMLSQVSISIRHDRGIVLAPIWMR